MKTKRLKVKRLKLGLKQLQTARAPGLKQPNPVQRLAAMSAPKPITSLTKAELTAELEEHQATAWNSKMSVIELRAILKEVRKVQNPEQGELKGLTTKKLAELQEQYRRLIGEDPEDRTRGLLMAAIRNYVMGTEIPTCKEEPKKTAATSSKDTTKVDSTK